MRATLLIILAASACTPVDPAASPWLEPLEGAEAVSAQVVPVVSDSPAAARAVVRRVNAYGLAVPSADPVALSTPDEGLVLPAGASATVDAFGYAVVLLGVAGPGRYRLEADGIGGEVWVAGGPPPSLSAIRSAVYPPEAPAASFAAAGTGGDAFAGDDQVWWQPHAPGAVAWRTAELPAAVEGMWSAHLDGDGVLDLAVWAGAQVFAMRGWPGGGYSWGGAWTAPEGTIAGLSVGDLDGDRATDIVVAINDAAGGAVVEVLKGDGAWGFSALEPLVLTFEADSVTAADEDVDGRPDVTVLRSADGTLRRFSLGEEGWAGGTPSQIGEGAYQALEGSTLLPMADLNGDATLEVLIEGARGASSQELVFFSLSGRSIVKYEQSYASYHVAVGDLEGDGADDLVAVEDGTLHLTRYDDAGGSYLAQNFDAVGAAGPVALGSVDGDALLDLVVFNDQPTYHPGAASEGATSPPGDPDCRDGVDDDGDGTTDAEDPECAAWRPASYGWQTFALALAGPRYLVRDLNGDGRADILGFTDAGGGLSVEAWLVEVDEDDQIQLRPGIGWEAGQAEPLGLVECDGEYFALTQAGKDPVLSELFVSTTGGVSQGDWERVEGSLLSCGPLGGVSAAAVVSTPAGAWTAYNRNLREVEAGFIEAVSAIAVADTDGDGAGEVVGCTPEGCDVLALDADGDGRDEVVRAEPGAGLVVEGWGSSEALAGPEGALRAVDADGDGVMELLVAAPAAGRALWYRGVPGGLLPPLGWWWGEAISGPGAMGDIDGDGGVELLLPDASGGLSHTPAGTR